MHKVVEKAVFDDVPAVVLEAPDIDMKVWAVLTTDNTLRTIAKLHRERKFPISRGLRMNRADKVSDAGLKAVSDGLGEHLLVRPVAVAKRGVTTFWLLVSASR